MTLRGEYWRVYQSHEGLYWARCVAGESLPRNEGGCTEWSSLPVPPGADVVLCVPGERVRIHTVSIPTRNRRRFQAALPFVLEEQLLREPHAYHFVSLSGKRDQAGTAVAVVEKDAMSDWLQAVADHGWRAWFLIPDFLAVAEPEPGVWLLDASATPFLLRRPRGEGGAALAGLPGSHPPGALLLAMESAASPPETLKVRVIDRDQSGRVEQWRTTLGGYNVELEIVIETTDRPAWLARQPLPDRQCNLLTGTYAPDSETRQWIACLAPAAGLAAALLIVLATQWFIEHYRIRAQHDWLEQAIETTYREAFIDARNLVDPRYQMEQRLQELQDRRSANSGSTDLLDWLEELAPVLSENDQYRIHTLNYDGAGITIEINVPNYESLERLQERLSQTNIQVDLENSELSNGRVNGRLYLRRQA